VVSASASTALPAAEGRRRPGVLAALGEPQSTVIGAMFACSWAGNQFTPLLLMYQHRDHYSSLLANALLGVYVLGLAPALLIAGPLSDRRGRRPVMMFGLLCAVAGSASLAAGPLGPGFVLDGRLLSGAAIGIAMGAGNGWLRELCAPAFSLTAHPGSAVRRGALAFSGGAGLGALTSGLLAQWGPLPQTLPFLVHIALTLPLLPLVAHVPETVGKVPRTTAWWRQLRVETARHPRFLRVVVIAAPWIFLGAAVSYGYLPTKLSGDTGSLSLAYASLSSVVALGSAAVTQPLAERLHTTTSGRGLTCAVLTISAGVAIAGLAVADRSPLLGLLANVFVGAGIGVGMISGGHEVQRIAGERELAGLTGLFYAAAYLGFFAPAIIAGLSAFASVKVLLWIVAAIGCLSAAAILASFRAHLPTAS
jgi:Major Facilitator Superfamily